MNVLTVYYSRTGNTQGLAQAIHGLTGGEIEEIREKRSRSGIKGYLGAGKDALMKTVVPIEDAEYNPEEYDLLIIGGPVWAFTIAPPVRVYLEKQKTNLPKVAFFCTEGGSGHAGAFKTMEKTCGKEPVAVLAVKEKDLKRDTPENLCRSFTKKILS